MGDDDLLQSSFPERMSLDKLLAVKSAANKLKLKKLAQRNTIAPNQVKGNLIDVKKTADETNPFHISSNIDQYSGSLEQSPDPRADNNKPGEYEINLMDDDEL